MAVDLSTFRRTMGSFVSGVTIVTTHYEGQAYGLTLSAFLSLSLEPPLVLICIDRTAWMSSTISRTGIFAVNVLSKKQQHLSHGFSSRSVERYEHFCHAEYSTKVTGAPVITGCSAYIDCRLITTYDGGDHTIFIGGVTDHDCSDVAPLLYFRGTYHSLADGLTPVHTR